MRAVRIAVLPAVVITVLAGLLACAQPISSADGTAVATTPAPVAATSTQPRPASTGPTTRIASASSPPSRTETGKMTARTSQGDAVEVTLEFSDLMPVTAVPNISACPRSFGQRTLAAKMTATVRVTSSMATEVKLIWDVNLMHAPIGLGEVYLLSEFSSGPSCKLAGLSDLNVRWASLAPGSRSTHTTYWIFTQAISPEHPQGDRAGLGRMFLRPMVFLSDVPAFDTQFSGERYVVCRQSGGGGQQAGFYLAGDRPERIDLGVAPDLICN
ncbi:MAG: hypothetical protein IRY85_12665 [Micromonosporaceae bacterium]|nr:hypothetical protein [Micromonosporaceae bacterium]